MNLDSERNRWLRKAATALKPLLAAASTPAPPQTLIIRVGSFPPRDGDLGGQFYPATPVFPTHIVVNRDISDSLIALCVLLHELCHFVTQDEKAAHGSKFKAVCRGVGLSDYKGQFLWTTPSASLHHELDKILTKLGAYPCARIQS